MSVTNDIVHDQRVCRIAGTLCKSGVLVKVVGRSLNTSVSRGDLPFSIFRFRMVFKKGPLFYACMNVRLFFFLLFRRIDILVANDLDTLLSNYLVSWIRRKPLVYDSHEYFTGVPEIQDRKVVLWFWRTIEKWIFPRLKNVYTVSPSIADKYSALYGVEVNVVRNLPLRWNISELPTYSQTDTSAEDKIIILQGTGINIDR